jgi:hypothetical protein
MLNNLPNLIYLLTFPIERLFRATAFVVYIYPLRRTFISYIHCQFQDKEFSKINFDMLDISLLEECHTYTFKAYVVTSS